jgi:hypothetical protein
MTSFFGSWFGEILLLKKDPLIMTNFHCNLKFPIEIYCQKFLNHCQFYKKKYYDFEGHPISEFKSVTLLLNNNQKHREWVEMQYETFVES